MQDSEVVVRNGLTVCGGCGGAKHYEDILCPVCKGSGEGDWPETFTEEHYAAREDLIAGGIPPGPHTFIQTIRPLARFGMKWGSIVFGVVFSFQMMGKRPDPWWIMSIIGVFACANLLTRREHD